MASILGFLLLESQPANAGKYGSNSQGAAAQSRPGATPRPARKALAHQGYSLPLRPRSQANYWAIIEQQSPLMTRQPH